MKNISFQCFYLRVQINFGGQMMIYIIFMKQKQKILKKFLRNSSTLQKVLDILGSETVADHFINHRNHQEELLEVDPQFLALAYQNLQERGISQSEDEENIVKTDVLSQGEPQLVAIFRSKGLISLHQYLNTISHKRYRQHSDYGYLLVSRYPDEFFIGTRCTHYHCKTTARKIQAQYGIFRKIQESQQEVDDEAQDQDFINDQESQQIIMIKKRKKKVKKDQEQAQKQETAIKENKQRLKKHKNNQLISQQSIRKSNRKKKMQIQNEDEDEQQNDLILQVFQRLQPNQILEILDYTIIFEFLSQKHIEKLSPIKDEMYIAVKFNENQAKRQKKSAKKSKSHNKKLSKSKTNLKDLSLYDLLVECSKHDLIYSEDLLQWQTKHELKEHPQLAHRLLEINPQGYVIQGEYMGSIQNGINVYIQTAYRQYQEKKGHQQKQQQQQQQQVFGEFEQHQNDEENESQFIQQDNQIEISNYSVDSAQQQLDDS